jgi:hypothetical protein
MIAISFRAADGLLLDVSLQPETVTPLIGELRIVSPVLAAKVEDAVHQDVADVWLDDEEVEFLAAAANVVRKSDRIDDSELDRITELV